MELRQKDGAESGLTLAHLLADRVCNRRPRALALADFSADRARSVDRGLADAAKRSFIADSERNSLVLASEGVKEAIEGNLSGGLANRAEAEALLRHNISVHGNIRVHVVVAIGNGMIEGRREGLLAQPGSNLECSESDLSAHVLVRHKGLVGENGSEGIAIVSEVVGGVSHTHLQGGDANVPPSSANAVGVGKLLPVHASRVESIRAQGLVDEASGVIDEILDHSVRIDREVRVVEVDFAVNTHGSGRVLLRRPRRTSGCVEKLERTREDELPEGARTLTGKEEVGGGPTRR